MYNYIIFMYGSFRIKITKTILVGFNNLYFFIIIFDLYRFFLNY